MTSDYCGCPGCTGTGCKECRCGGMGCAPPAKYPALHGRVLPIPNCLCVDCERIRSDESIYRRTLPSGNNLTAGPLKQPNVPEREHYPKNVQVEVIVQENPVKMLPVDWRSIAARKLFDLRLETARLNTFPAAILISREESDRFRIRYITPEQFYKPPEQSAYAPPPIPVTEEQNATDDLTGANLKEWQARVLRARIHRLFTSSAKGKLYSLLTACDCPECAWNRKPLTWTEAAGLKLVDYPSKLRRWLRSHQAYRIKRFLWGRPIERLVWIAYRLRGRA